MKENIITINGRDYCYRVNLVKHTLAIHEPIMAIVDLKNPEEIRIYQHDGDESKARRDIKELLKSISVVANT